VRENARAGFTAILLSVAALAATPAHGASSQVATVSATVVKPLALRWLQDLDLGTIVLGPGTWSNATVAISRTGVFSCTNANVTCSGATKVAKYNVIGTNNQTARITAPNVTLVNQSDPTKTLTLTVDSPGSVPIPNSGQPGVDFALGGSISVSSTTAGGVYSGTFNVTVDY
jgi:hypothetical protein